MEHGSARGVLPEDLSVTPSRSPEVVVSLDCDDLTVLTLALEDFIVKTEKANMGRSLRFNLQMIYGLYKRLHYPRDITPRGRYG